MILRVLVLAGGLLGGATASQFPEFAQQYQQRLGGAVDALAEVVADFDTSARAAGLSRDAALAQMQGTEFLDRRRADMTRTFDRYDRLRADLAALQDAGPFMRAYHAARSTDGEVANAALTAFKPALPLTFAGAAFAGAGFLAGLLAMSATLKLLLWPFAGRRRTARGT
ncbi:DUF2937 family protein [Tateyamaria omphalii]|uniref:DUF2937 domain-containing protein n=1 Tax=Tateyamaria omphalii TaxID=299262 RepID=A0A1P8MSC9_9RHOB|nr:DUF2937 family protein [Tateyamaria omphalii]APX10997.1 hypothetical protein BWR18_04300 [Tateyamaria omphalii]